MSTPEQIVYDVLGQCGVLHGTRWYAARYVVESLHAEGLLVEGSPQCNDDGCLHYDHSPEQDDPMDEDLTVYWVCGECGAKESVRGAAMATGPKHTCEGPEPTPSDDLSEALRDPHADPDATPMSGEAAVQYRPAPSADREKLIAEGRARRKQGTWEGAADLIDRLTDALADPAPVDEAKLAEVIDRAENSTQTGSKPHRHRVIARAVIEYLKGER